MDKENALTVNYFITLHILAYTYIPNNLLAETSPIFLWFSQTPKVRSSLNSELLNFCLTKLYVAFIWCHLMLAWKLAEKYIHFVKQKMLNATPWARVTKNVKKPQSKICESCRKAWFKIFVKQYWNNFFFQSHILIWCLLLFKISFNKPSKPYQWQSHQVWGFFTFWGDLAELKKKWKCLIATNIK